MADDIEIRRRRAIYRAIHRGTREMDWLLGRYAEAHVAAMDEPQLARFEQLLALPDPEIQRWILGPEVVEGLEFAPEIATLRAYHALDRS
ncbi:MAG: succinate dehydrogenase assembly factor 2 [Hyphomicrobiaceae bacterium]